jgi:hypothetical protein
MAKKVVLQSKDKLNVKNFGLSIGIVSGIGMLIIGLLSTWFDYGNSIVTLIGEVYIGFSASIIGSIFGGIYGFVDGFVGGVVIAWIYNKLQNKSVL